MLLLQLAGPEKRGSKDACGVRGCSLMHLSAGMDVCKVSVAVFFACS